MFIVVRAGRQLWLQLNCFHKLTENMRQSKCPELAAICRDAREGKISSAQLAVLNGRIKLQYSDAAKEAPGNALWCASTNDMTRDVNSYFFSELNRSEETPGFRFYARHLPKNMTTDYPTESTRQSLCQIAGGTVQSQASENGKFTQPMNYLDLAIGSRMSLTHNASVDLGLFNGSMGTVVSIAFPERDVPTCRIPSSSQAATEDAYLPIIYVCFDNYVGPSYCKPKPGEVWSPDDERRRVVPVGPIMARSPVTPRGKYYRQYIPLIPAMASTMHRAQSRTTPAVILPTPKGRGKNFAMGLMYIGISRPEYLKHLFAVGGVFRSDHFTSHEHVRVLIRREYERLASLLTPGDEDGGDDDKGTADKTQAHSVGQTTADCQAFVKDNGDSEVNDAISLTSTAVHSEVTEGMCHAKNARHTDTRIDDGLTGTVYCCLMVVCVFVFPVCISR